MKIRRMLAIVCTALMMTVFFSSLASATIVPGTFSATLNPGECTSDPFTVDISESAPIADVLFVFDLTGSMSGALNGAKAGATDIMNSFSSTDIKFGVASFMDYPGYFVCPGPPSYIDTFGAPGDYPYMLNQALTTDKGDVQTAINALSLGSGWDGPESYSRALFESYSDLAIDWRAGAKKIVVMFGDNIPHDYSLSTGIDPGRDATVGTADDLAIADVIAGMATNNVELVYIDSGGYYLSNWQAWAAVTGGQALAMEGEFVTTVVAAITEGLATPTVEGLHIVASDGYEGWLTASDPVSYSGETGVSIPFTVTICAPKDAECGLHEFTLSAVDVAGVVFGIQEVAITVPCGGCAEPKLDICKSGPEHAMVGEVIKYTITVRHAADSDGSDISDVVLKDTLGDPVYKSGDDCDGILEACEVWTYEMCYTVQACDRDPLGNEVTVTGMDLDGESLWASAEHYVDIVHPGIAVEKTGPEAAYVGEEITYTFIVTNTGDVPLSMVGVVDSLAGEASYVSGDVNCDDMLDLCEVWIFSDTWKVRACPDPLNNEATATGYFECTPFTASSRHSLDVEHEAVLLVTKTGPECASVGETITYTITVQHDPSSDMSAVRCVKVVDDLGTPVYVSGDDGDGVLECWEVWTFEMEYTIQACDPNPLVNVAGVSGIDLDGDAVIGSDGHEVNIVAPPPEDECPPPEDECPPPEDECPPVDDGCPPPEDECPPPEDGCDDTPVPPVDDCDDGVVIPPVDDCDDTPVPPVDDCGDGAVTPPVDDCDDVAPPVDDCGAGEELSGAAVPIAGSATISMSMMIMLFLAIIGAAGIVGTVWFFRMRK